jgi:hypothetical protein
MDVEALPTPSCRVTRYARAPSAALRDLLMPGSSLAPLLERQSVAGLQLDVHLREKDHVHVYCGGARIVDARLSRGRVHVDAHRRYKVQPCGAGLFNTWTVDAPSLGLALDRYYAGVVVSPRWITGEGAVQAHWAAVREPWVPFDREAVLGYGDRGARNTSRAAPRVAAAWAELEPRLVAEGWALPSRKRDGAALDQLGVDAQGRLVLIELKDAAAKDAKSIFYAPLQLLQYVHEWAAAYDIVRADLDAVREARIALGLSPASTPRLSRGLRPVIGFGAGVCSAVVLARFDIVHAVVNRHLPSGVPSIEVWALPAGRPVRLG